MSEESEELTLAPFSLIGLWRGAPNFDEYFVKLHDARRPHGVYVLGASGMGKSTLLVGLMAGDATAGRGFVVLDPHGDLIDDVLARLGGWGRREEEVVLLDLRHPTVAFGLNLFACAAPHDPIHAAETAERVVGAFKRVWGDSSWGPRLEDLLGNVALTLIEHQGRTLADVPPLLTNRAFRRQLAGALANPVVRSYWFDEYEHFPRQDRVAIAGTLLNKARAFLRNPLLRAIVAQPESSVDFRAVMDAGKILLVRLDARLEEATNLLGSVIVLQLLEAAFSRKDLPPGSRPLFSLYADEFHRFATPAFGTLLAEARKYGVGTVLAHQRRDQLPDDTRNAPLGAETIVCFRLTPEDALDLAWLFSGLPDPAANGATPPRPLDHVLRHGHEDQRVVERARRVEQGFTAELERRRRLLNQLKEYEQRARELTRSSVLNDELRGEGWLHLVARVPLEWRSYDPQAHMRAVREAAEEFLYRRMLGQEALDDVLRRLYELAAAGVNESTIAEEPVVVEDRADRFAAVLSSPDFPFMKVVWRTIPGVEERAGREREERKLWLRDIGALAELLLRRPITPLPRPPEREAIVGRLVDLPARQAIVRVQGPGGGVLARHVETLATLPLAPPLRVAAEGRAREAVLRELGASTGGDGAAEREEERAFFDEEPPPFVG